jgi:P-type Cu+ transporter
MSVRRTHLEITGMSCATCSGTIEEAVGSLPGVREVDANFATDEGSVAYDPEAVSLAEIYDAIEEAGYEPARASATVEISGMSCSTCAETNERAIESVPGVIEATVNYAADEARVAYNPADVEFEAVYDAVEDAGYEPIREESGDGDDWQGEARESAAEREMQRQWRLTVLGGVLTAPFAVLMAAMFLPVSLPESLLGVPLGWIEFVLATLLMATLGREFLRGAYRAAVNAGRANMDTLVAVGTGAGYLYSSAVLVGAITGGLYFEAVAFILWFITLGNWLEARSKTRAGDALRKLLEMEAEEATVVRDVSEPGSEDSETEARQREEHVVPLKEVEVGDLMKVRPGERVPTDGVVREGESAVDESMVTGESVPVEKGAGDEVIGSTINENGLLLVEATRVGEDTAIQGIVERVKEAQSRQPDIQRLVDRVSAYFVPAVIANAVLWAIAWYAFPDALFDFVELLPLWTPVGGGPVAGGVPVLEFSMIVLASAILIACPCALGLATPAATMVGSTISATNGVLFKGGDVLERSRGVEAVVFDKTGTLTRGEMALTDVVAIDEARADGDGAAADGGAAIRTRELDERAVLAAAASAESGSEHPLARAIVEGATERGIDPEEPEAFENVPGHGIRATVGGSEVLVGNRRLLREAGIDPAPAEATMERLEREGKTAMLVARVSPAIESGGGSSPDDDGELLGALATADTVRESAKRTVAALRERGLDVLMLTGDNERTARAVAREVGIPEGNVRAEVLPEDKADAIDDVQRGGRRAMMVGDGVNDAPALTAAHVGVAIGSGTDVAIESADVTLMRDDPADVLKAIRISEATISKVHQNLFWAFVYNTTLIPIASLGLLNPALAGLAMAGSSVSVMANSLAFRGYDPHEEYRPFGFLR